jgi:hypothetical protein
MMTPFGLAVTGVAQQTLGRVGFELVQHVAHRHEQLARLGRHGRVMDPRTDQEDNEVPVELGGGPARNGYPVRSSRRPEGSSARTGASICGR